MSNSPIPSSLIIVALAVAWLAVLVPMFARRRQEVSRTADSALAGRVVRRGSDCVPRSGRKPKATAEEGFAMSQVYEQDDVEQDRDDTGHAEDGEWRQVNTDDARAGRRYRPGRGGFDPEAAALAARAKYAYRQRVVLAMLVLAVGTGVLAAMAAPMVWWLHAVVDVALIGYLTYLRRQVRIEEDVRRRRLARMSDPRRTSPDDAYDTAYEESPDQDAYAADAYAEEGYAAGDYAGDGYDGVTDDSGADGDGTEGDRDDLPRGTEGQEVDEAGLATVRSMSSRRSEAPARPNAHVIELDDEDPIFDELDEHFPDHYRRAAGE